MSQLSFHDKTYVQQGLKMQFYNQRNRHTYMFALNVFIFVIN